MPIYEYRCENGHTLEILQRMSDDPISSCTTCHAPVQRVFHPVAVHFKGSGFYTTDYGRNHAKGSDDAKPKTDSESPKKTSSDDSATTSSSDPKPKAGSSDSKPSKS